MASLKRLLNDEETVADQFPPFNFYNGSHLDENPVLGDQSWSNVWDGLLDPVSASFGTPDCLNDNDGNAKGESAAVASHLVETGIESWATQCLPQADVSLQSDDTGPSTPDDGYVQDFNGKICYGVVYKTSVKLIGEMVTIDAKLRSENRLRNKPHQPLKLKKDDKGLLLVFPDDTEFGLLNNHATRALEDIVTSPLIEADAMVEIRPLIETLGRATKAADAKTRVSITLYGPLDSKARVGKKLSKEKIYLQKPDYMRTGSIYQNPHILTFPDLQTVTVDPAQEVEQNGTGLSSTGLHFEKEITQVYASLKRAKNLERIEGDNRLKTKLLPHQKEALSFMTQRENGPIPLAFSLWKPLSGEDEGWFRHEITQRRSRNQQLETGGGILADEMGMGKTLSILALVTKTLTEAQKWASEHIADDVDSVLLAKKRTLATLVIVPSALLINTWEDEVAKHLDGALKKLRYHGLQRKGLASGFEEVDIVVTTYHTLVADYNSKASPLHKLDWFRIVLDEAHIIRRQATTFNRAVSDLVARSRWCLTGTPIQNRLTDIGALFAFIRAHPFDSIATFKRYISIPFEENEDCRAKASGFLALLLDSICLRRTKDLLHLPDRRDQIHMLEFTRQERDQYEHTKSIMNRALRQRVGESFVKSRFGMFQVQLQLRILCNHGTYQHPFSWAKRSLMDEKEDALCSIGNLREIKCSACRQFMPVLESNNIYRTNNTSCAHMICAECIWDGIGQRDGTRIPDAGCLLCQPGGSLNHSGKSWSKANKGASHEEPYFRPQGHSSKMEALMADVRQDLDSTKSIIFSSWTNTLNLVGSYLTKEAIPFYRIDGECPLLVRQKILDRFANSQEKPVLIMTTGTGAFGLNLTSANRVFIVEPQWNPSVENQAIARAQRLGQGKSVLVTRYMMKKTVEEEMRVQQEHKLRIAELGNGTQSQDISSQDTDEPMRDM